MIYLIGGPPRCGKSTLARHLAATLQISWLSVDYLSTVVSGYIPDHELQTRYPSLEVPRDNEIRYAHYSATEIIENYRTKAATTWQAMRWFIEYALGDQRDFILEGYQVEPRFVHEMQYAEGQGNIRSMFLYREDVSDIAVSLLQASEPNDWVLRTTRAEQTFNRIAAMISEYGTWFRKEVAQYQLVALNVDYDFLGQLDQARAYLLQRP